MGLSAQDKNRILGRIGLIIGGIPVLGVSLMIVDIMRRKVGMSFPVALILILIVGGGTVWGFLKLFFNSALTGRPENEDLLQNGAPGVARVLEKSDTGWTVNTQPRVELLLEVHLALPDCPAYQAKIKTLIPRLQPDLYDPGTLLEVRVDPKKFLKRIAIVGIASAEEVDHGSDPLVSRPEKSRKKSRSRKGGKSTHEPQKDNQE